MPGRLSGLLHNTADNGVSVKVALAYCALIPRLDATALKVICEAMVKEAHEFDVKMKAAGLL